MRKLDYYSLATKNLINTVCVYEIICKITITKTKNSLNSYICLKARKPYRKNILWIKCNKKL